VKLAVEGFESDDTRISNCLTPRVLYGDGWFWFQIQAPSSP